MPLANKRSEHMRDLPSWKSDEADVSSGDPAIDRRSFLAAGSAGIVLAGLGVSACGNENRTPPADTAAKVGGETETMAQLSSADVAELNFSGLCLFAKGTQTDRIHVLLPAQRDHTPEICVKWETEDKRNGEAIVPFEGNLVIRKAGTQFSRFDVPGEVAKIGSAPDPEAINGGKAVLAAHVQLFIGTDNSPAKPCDKPGRGTWEYPNGQAPVVLTTLIAWPVEQLVWSDIRLNGRALQVNLPAGVKPGDVKKVGISVMHHSNVPLNMSAVKVGDEARDWGTFAPLFSGTLPTPPKLITVPDDPYPKCDSACEAASRRAMDERAKAMGVRATMGPDPITCLLAQA